MRPAGPNVNECPEPAVSRFELGKPEGRRESGLSRWPDPDPALEPAGPFLPNARLDQLCAGFLVSPPFAAVPRGWRWGSNELN